MRSMLVLCALMVGVAFGTGSDLGHRGPYPTGASIGEFPGTDDVIVSQPFIFANMTNGLGCNSANSWMIADDATPAGSIPMDVFEFWTLYTGSPANTWKIQIRDDATGPGTTVLWTQDVINVVNTNTGLYGWSYPVYNCLATPVAPTYAPVGGTKIWLCFQSLDGSAVSYFCASNMTWAQECFWSGDNGSSWSSSTANWGVAYELNMIVTGTPGSLESSTWGTIKSTF